MFLSLNTFFVFLSAQLLLTVTIVNFFYILFSAQILWFCGVDFRDKDGPAFRSRDQRKVQRWLRAEFDTSRGMLYMHGTRSLTSAYWMDYRGYGQDILDPEVRHFTNKCFNAGPPDEK